MKRYVILIPFHNPWHWHTDYANQTAKLLAKRHIVVCFLWGDTVSLWELLRGKKQYRPIAVQGNLWHIQPLFLLPGKRLLTIQFINMFFNLIAVHLLCSFLAVRYSRSKLFWFFGYYDPVFLLLPPFFRHWRTMYDCVDRATHPNPKLARWINTSENLLLQHAWIVVANSQTLRTYLRIRRPDVFRVPLGFRIEAFRHPKPYILPLTDNRPIIGYIGSIDYRLDITLLHALITTHRTWRFALIGPVFFDHLSEKNKKVLQTIITEPNVYHAIVRPTQIPSILSQCSVAIIPFDTRVTFGRFAFPMKIMEYFYAQKPIVSSPIKELTRFVPLVQLARNAREWTEAIQTALNHPLTTSQKRQMRMIAMRNTWEKKIHAITRYLDAKKVASTRPNRHDLPWTILPAAAPAKIKQ